MSSYKEYLSKEPNEALGKKLKSVIWVLCVVVFALVVMMRSPYKIPLPEGVNLSFLPPVHALLNSLVALCLVVAILSVKAKKICLNKKSINVAMVLSILFLLCYVAYHFTTKETLYGDSNHDGEVTAEEKLAAGSMRAVYFFVLISHIVLAAVSLPMILFTWLYGVTNQYAKHRKLAKITFPVWFYVALTGPVCYFMLKQYYN